MKNILWRELNNKLANGPIVVKICGYDKKICCCTTNTILNNNSKIKYEINNSTKYLPFDSFYTAFVKSLIKIIRTGNKEISAADLANFVPATFNEYNKGQVCHRSAFFAILKILRIAQEPKRGKNNAYFTIIFP